MGEQGGFPSVVLFVLFPHVQGMFYADVLDFLTPMGIGASFCEGFSLFYLPFVLVVLRLCYLCEVFAYVVKRLLGDGMLC